MRMKTNGQNSPRWVGAELHQKNMSDQFIPLASIPKPLISPTVEAVRKYMFSQENIELQSLYQVIHGAIPISMNLAQDESIANSCVTRVSMALTAVSWIEEEEKDQYIDVQIGLGGARTSSLTHALLVAALTMDRSDERPAKDCSPEEMVIKAMLLMAKARAEQRPRMH